MSNTTVIEHGDFVTVFLPEQAGVSVWRTDKGSWRCDEHQIGLGACKHIQVLQRR